MNSKERKVQIPSLATIGGGAVAEQFEHEFLKVMSNIVDPNCAFDAKREIVVRIVFKPLSENGEVAVGSSVRSTLAPQKATITTMFVESAGPIVGATEYVPTRDRESQYAQ